MQSLRELYRIGTGPSSSHTMGPALAAGRFRARFPTAAAFRAELFGSLAATGRGHGTDVALIRAFAPTTVGITWLPEVVPAFHPNGLELTALGAASEALGSWRVFSVGGGALREEGEPDPVSVYPITDLAEILAWSAAAGRPLWEYVREREGDGIFTHLALCWEMNSAACTSAAI